ncbi:MULTISPECIES: MATE family efflux transporter [Haloferax]|uniref:Multidrug-efflux transporter n=2 Tax=Haloferax mediterranei (strain ATCC 33500 / DSM 1411 / JCM 8866 / NBRC 14739 / NCIMB 2177 / R-4) TaxID=523841 RepID=I3R5R1_HALMT|nr:MATE family efflux transporter [Haloferax mediterranei]AFK19571.2 MATE family drug/sodium antiporter [Haloferax mediterranei ATCC 33500]MDX5987688.1 MATE family efflux transporter [Haloferax mediterranei ATCC 33500]
MSVPEGGSLTEGDLKRPMFELAWPIIVTELLQVAYNLADTVWLGRLSTDAVAAISLAFPLIFLLISVGGGFTVAGSTLVAQCTGAKSEGSAGTVAGQTLTFITIIAIVVGLIGFFATDAMLGILPSSPATAGQVIPLASAYMRVFFLGLPFLFGFFVFSALMRGYGNTRAPMVVMFISVLINVIIDPIFIFGFESNPLFGMLGLEGLEASLFAATSFLGYDVAGAAYATVLSRAVATVIGIYVIFGTSAGPDVQLSDFWPQFRYIKQIVSIGVPSAAEQSATALGFITLTAMVVTFKPEVVAAFGLGNRLTSLVFLPALGLGRATNTIVGQNLGAQKPERAESAVWLAAKVGASVMVVTGVLAYLLAEPVVSFFLPTGTESATQTIDLGVQYVRIRAFEFGFIGVLQVVLGAYRGAGNTKTALGFSLFALWLGRVPIVYLLSFQFGFAETGIWLGMAVGQILGAIAATAWFTRGTWKQSVISAEPSVT